MARTSFYGDDERFDALEAPNVYAEQAAASAAAAQATADELSAELGTAALKANNLSDLADASAARTNLGLGDSAVKNVGTAAGTVAAGDDSRITGAAQKASNLSDLASAPTARTNLGLGDSATKNVGTAAGTVAAGDDSRITGAAQKASNLSDLANAGTARTNLGLGDSATKNTGTSAGTVAAGDDSRITGAAQKASNLSDLASAPTARTNLGLGDSATKNVGTTAGTVAAGDDARFSGTIIDTDGTMAADSDAVVPSQKATRTYVASTLSGLPAFKANKNGTNQTNFTDNTLIKVTFTTEAFDNGSYYDATNSKWTPPAGAVFLSAHVQFLTTNMLSGARLILCIYKNGALLESVDITYQGVVISGHITTVSQCNGTDYFEVYALLNTNGTPGGDGAISGGVDASSFCGHQIIKS